MSQNTVAKFRRFSLSFMAALVMFVVPVSSGAMLFSPVGASASTEDSGNGNNGTLKVHEYGTEANTESNDPKVCHFNLEGYGFDAGQIGYVMFTKQGGDGPDGVDAGPFNVGPADKNGDFTTEYYDLQPGHYKVTMFGKKNGEGESVDLKAKSKVFKVECGDGETVQSNPKAVYDTESECGTVHITLTNVVKTEGENEDRSSDNSSDQSGTSYTAHISAVGSDNESQDVVVKPNETKDIVLNYPEDSSPSDVVVTVGDTTILTVLAKDIVTNCKPDAPKTGSLKVIKHVVNDVARPVLGQGDQLSAEYFTMTVSGNNPSQTSFSGSEDGTTVTLEPGEFSVGEQQNPNYTMSTSGDCGGDDATIAAGDNLTCTITNTLKSGDVLGSESVPNPHATFTPVCTEMGPAVRVVLTNPIVDDESIDTIAYTAHIYAPGALQVPSDVTVQPGGTQTVYVLYLEGSNPNSTIDVSVGDNDPFASFDGDINTNCGGGQGGGNLPTIKVIKHVINDNGGTKKATDFTMTVSSNDRSDYVFPGSEDGVTNNIYAGQFSVTEGAHDGYTMTMSGDCSGTAEAGQELVCTITNNDIDPGQVLGASTSPSPTPTTAVLPVTGSKNDYLEYLLALIGAAAAYGVTRRYSNKTE